MTTKPLPQHVAIIMDGNGRWAETRGRNRTFGHLRGARVAREIIEACSERGVENLTLYTFSSENWLRPLEEVSFLMALLSRHLKRERANLVKNNIRFYAIGELSRLPASVLAEVDETIRATASCTGMRLTFALSYGGRQDILSAVKSLIADGVSPDSITEKALESRLQTAGLRDPDLIIRTSGESRLSNFFLWQSAYSEIFITPTLWPDYTATELDTAFSWYQSRERRFGRTTAQITRANSAASEPIGAT
ncbi:polyprenyl diphosphate synthase [soil metagenome]